MGVNYAMKFKTAILLLFSVFLLTVPFALSAEAAEPNYTIVYNLGGGKLKNGLNAVYTGSNGKLYKRNPTSVSHMGTPEKGYAYYFKVDHPTRTGHTFAGWKITGMDKTVHKAWYDGAAHSFSIYAVEPKSSPKTSNALFYSNLRATAGKVTFTAQWKPIPYTATFSVNGGKWKDGTVKDKQKSYTMVDALSLTASAPERSGYVFAGWKASETGNWAGETFATNKLANKTGKYGSVTFTAQWRAIYTIKYNLGGGKFAQGYDQTIITNGQTEAVNPTKQAYNGMPGKYVWFVVRKPVRTGYTFTGWKITGMNTCLHHYYPGSPKTDKLTNTTTTQNSFYNLRSTPGTVTFTAQWKANKYTVRYMVDGNLYKTKTCSYNTGFSFEAFPSPPVGKHYTVWKSESGSSYTPGVMFVNLTSKNGEVITLTAATEINTVTITPQRNDVVWNASPSSLLNQMRLVGSNGKSYTPSSKGCSAVFTNIPNGSYNITGILDSKGTKGSYGYVTVSNNNRSIVLKFYTYTIQTIKGANVTSDREGWCYKNRDVRFSCSAGNGYDFVGWDGMNGKTPFYSDSADTTIKIAGNTTVTPCVIVKGGKAVSPFYKYDYWTVNSVYGDPERSSLHRGVDLGTWPGGDYSTLGDDVCAVAAGTVVDVGWSGYGNYVIIDHGNNMWTMYAHLMCEEDPHDDGRPSEHPVVKPGDQVKQGQLIGHAGNTFDASRYGFSSGAHLHFEVRVGENSRDNTIDPLKMFPELKSYYRAY